MVLADRHRADAGEMGHRQSGLLGPGVELVLYFSQVLLRGRMLRDIEAGIAQAGDDVAGQHDAVLADEAQKKLARAAAESRALLGQEIDEADLVGRGPLGKK